MSSILNGLKHAAIVFGVMVLGGVLTAMTNFHPDTGVPTFVWTAVSAFAIGGVTALIHWLQNKDAK